MLRSMTGFSRAEVDNDAYRVAVEIRTVNHRYLDVRLRGTAGLAALERQVRDRIGAEIGRGKVDASVYVKPKSESAYVLDVDHALLKEVVETAETIVPKRRAYPARFKWATSWGSRPRFK